MQETSLLKRVVSETMVPSRMWQSGSQLCDPPDQPHSSCANWAAAYVSAASELPRIATVAAAAMFMSQTGRGKQLVGP